MTTPRLAPEIPFPPYGFVPGLNAHPNHPGGHSHGKPPLVSSPLRPERWWECRAYLYGFDLFNGGFYWEAHETWEPLWLAEGRRGPAADLLKGLIRLAACGVKIRQRRPDGAASHAAGAAALFRRAEAAGGGRLGLDAAEMERLARAVTVPEPPDAEPPARTVFGFVLEPIH